MTHPSVFRNYSVLAVILQERQAAIPTECLHCHGISVALLNNVDSGVCRTPAISKAVNFLSPAKCPCSLISRR